MLADVTIRAAAPSDRESLISMHALSLRSLATPYYAEDVVEAFIALGTLDASLIGDGTYYVAVEDGEIVGCGGWSMRTPGYAAAAHRPAPEERPKPTVRAVYVHPAAIRRGIARRLMQRIESEIAANGFALGSLTATLSGLPLYRRLGWKTGAPVSFPLPGGLNMTGMTMTKPLWSEDQRLALAG